MTSRVLICAVIATLFACPAFAWEADQPFRAIIEVAEGAVTAPNSVICAPVNFSGLLTSLEEDADFDQYSLRVEPLEGAAQGQSLPFRFDHDYNRGDGSYMTSGDIIFVAPQADCRRYAIYFGPEGTSAADADPVPLIGDGDLLRLQGDGNGSFPITSAYPQIIDFDGDGRRDMVGSSNYGTGATATWYRNIGTDSAPAFSERETYTLQTEFGEDITNPNIGWMLTTSIVDWDNDGIRDLLVGGWCRYLTFHKNLGTNEAPRYAAGKQIFDAKVFPGYDYGRSEDTPYQGVFIETADWNGDGEVDLLVGTYARGHIYLLLNKGRDEDGLPVLDEFEALQAGGVEIDWATHSKPTVADWDGDGDLDLMSGQYDTMGEIKGTYYFENTGTREAPVLAEGVQLVDAAGAPIVNGFHNVPTMVDWDLDGTMDVIISDATGTVLYLNEGTAAEPKLTRTPIPYRGYETVMANGAFAYPVVLDYDGDGTLDIATGDGEGTALLFKGVGNGQYARAEAIKSLGVPIDEVGCPDGGEAHRGYMKLTFADWNGDGHRDLIMYSENGEQGWQRGWKEDSWAIKFFPGTADPMDFGAPVEVKAAGEHIIPTYRGKPDVVDFDGDGLLDLVLASGEGSRREGTHIMFYKNIGSKTAFELAAPVPLQHQDGSPIECGVRLASYVVDWDGDGDLDLMTGAHSSRNVRYLENVGTRTEPRFSAYQPFAAVNKRISSHHEVGPYPADLDGDGSLDLVVGNGDSGTIHFFRRAWLEGQPQATVVAVEAEDGRTAEGTALQRGAAEAMGAEVGEVPDQPATAGDATLLLAAFDGDADSATGIAPLLSTGQFVEGRFGQALHLAGDQMLVYPTAGTFDPSGGAIECWVRPDWAGGDDRNHYILSADNTFPNDLFWLLIAQDGSLRLQTSDGKLNVGPSMKLASRPLNWQPGEWHFVSCRWGSSGAQLLVDGLEVAATEDVVVPPQLGQELHIGNLFNRAWCFDGAIDDLHISGPGGNQ